MQMCLKFEPKMFVPSFLDVWIWFGLASHPLGSRQAPRDAGRRGGHAEGPGPERAASQVLDRLKTCTEVLFHLAACAGVGPVLEQWHTYTTLHSTQWQV